MGTPASCLGLVSWCLFLNKNDQKMRTDNKHRHERLSTTTLNVILLTRLMSYLGACLVTMWRYMARPVIMLQYSEKSILPSWSLSRVSIRVVAISFCMRHKHNNMHAIIDVTFTGDIWPSRQQHTITCILTYSLYGREEARPEARQSN